VLAAKDGVPANIEGAAGELKEIRALSQDKDHIKNGD
jgi:hypothetical protein